MPQLAELRRQIENWLSGCVVAEPDGSLEWLPALQKIRGQAARAQAGLVVAATTALTGMRRRVRRAPRSHRVRSSRTGAPAALGAGGDPGSACVDRRTSAGLKSRHEITVPNVGGRQS